VLPGVAEAQNTDVPSIETAQNTNTNINLATNEELQPAPEPPERLMVYPGDSLWSISQRHLGPQASPQQTANEAEQIFELNRDRIGDDPNLLMPGEKLLLPSPASKSATDPPADRPEDALGVGESVASASAESAAEQAARTASEPVEPAVDAFSEMLKASWLNERRLIGWALLVLTSVLAMLIVWKKYLRRQGGREAWGTFSLVNHQTPRKASTNEVVGNQLVAPSQLRKGSSKSAHEPWVITQAERHLYLAGTVHPRPELLRRSEPPISRSIRDHNGWATGMHDQQVRRALTRMTDTRGY
jgi:LysM repeat protein